MNAYHYPEYFVYFHSIILDFSIVSSPQVYASLTPSVPVHGCGIPHLCCHLGWVSFFVRIYSSTLVSILLRKAWCFLSLLGYDPKSVLLAIWGFELHRCYVSKAHVCPCVPLLPHSYMFLAPTSGGWTEIFQLFYRQGLRSHQTATHQKVVSRSLQDLESIKELKL